MDVKAPFDRYEAVTRVRGGGDFARRSLEAVLRSGVEHEFRTTYHPALLSPGDLAEIAATLAAAGVRRYAVQRFRAAGCPDARLAAAGETEFPEGLADSIRPLFSSFIVR
jgi:pyruvate-formate lyase-activating enzyme